MSDLASLNVKIDRTVKKEADSIANAMGMTLSTAINIFVRQMVSERAIPFKIHLTNNDAEQFHQLIDSIRVENQERGFLSDDEINAEIQAYRSEKRQGKACATGNIQHYPAEPFIMTPADFLSKAISVAPSRRKAKLGGWEGKINVPDDFNAPIEDFKEYME